MNKVITEVIQNFSNLLAEVSMEEIIINRELSLRAQLLRHLLAEMYQD